MRKLKKLALFIILMLSTVNVYAACADIEELETSVGTISAIDSINFQVTVPEGTKEVTLAGRTSDSWLEGYGPRTVPTSQTAELKVYGNTCDFATHTFYVHFKTAPKIIAENTPTPEPPATSPTQNENPQTPEAPTGNEPTSTTPEEGGAPTSSSNLLLKKLEITSYEIDFDPYKYEYELDVDLDVKFLSIKAEAEDETIIVEISSNAYSLKDGENLISITLKDLTTGNTNVYHLTVNRVEPKSNNNYLASLSIAGHQLNFDPSVTYYKVEIGKESSLDITAITESELANHEIIGNTRLQDGSTVTVRVTAEDGSTRDYILNIVKVFNIMDYWIYIVILLLVLLLIILLLIMKQKKNKKKLGPQTLEGLANTAGVVQEIAPQNSAPVTPSNSDGAKNEPTNLNSAPGTATLKIIEPTNIETPPEQPIESADEKSPTEVFQL